MIENDSIDTLQFSVSIVTEERQKLFVNSRVLVIIDKERLMRSGTLKAQANVVDIRTGKSVPGFKFKWLVNGREVSKSTTIEKPDILLELTPGEEKLIVSVIATLPGVGSVTHKSLINIKSKKCGEEEANRL